MKYIFDFDDVLFYNTSKLKQYIATCIDEAGIDRTKVDAYYQEVRGGEFSLKNFTHELILKEGVKNVDEASLYKKIMKECPNFLNGEMVDLVKTLGKENCYIVTYGEFEFNTDKVYGSGVDKLFSEVIVVSGSKKDAVENIAYRYKDEKVLFVDDKAKHFEDLDLVKHPNLKTILFDENGLEKLKREIR